MKIHLNYYHLNGHTLISNTFEKLVTINLIINIKPFSSIWNGPQCFFYLKPFITTKVDDKQNQEHITEPVLQSCKS